MIVLCELKLSVMLFVLVNYGLSNFAKSRMVAAARLKIENQLVLNYFT
jgi:hypothetical protein